jgi:outer membrane protein
MKGKILSVVLTAALLTAPVTLASKGMEPVVGFQIAYIDLEEVSSSQIVSRKLESLNADFESRKNDFESAKVRLNNMQEEFDKESAAMTKMVRENRDLEIKEMANKLSRQGAEMQGEYYARQQEIKAAFYKQVSEISEELAKKYNIQVVFPRHALLYADKEFNLTDELMRRLA